MQRAVGKHAAFLSSHRRVHAGSVFGSTRPALAGHMREGVWASQRMLVFELISAHANITPTPTISSAQFISARLLPSRKGITRCRRCCGRSRGRQSTPRLSHHLPSRSRPWRRVLQSRLSSRPLSMFSSLCLYVWLLRPHVQAWLSWSQRGTVNPQVVGSILSKTRKLKFPWI